MGEKASPEEKTNPILTEFDFWVDVFDCEEFKTLRFDKPPREWVEFVVHNRNRKGKASGARLRHCRSTYCRLGYALIERGIDINEAQDFLWQSDTYARLADESSGLCLQPWTETFNLLLKELPPDR
jgi:hypothetical protein